MGDREGSFNGFLSGVTPGVKGGKGVGKVLTSTNGPDHHSGHAPLRQSVAAGGPLLQRRSGPPAATEITPRWALIVAPASGYLLESKASALVLRIQG